MASPEPASPEPTGQSPGAPLGVLGQAAVLSDEVPSPGGFCTRGGELAEGYQG